MHFTIAYVEEPTVKNWEIECMNELISCASLDVDNSKVNLQWEALVAAKETQESNNLLKQSLVGCS